VAVVQLIVIVVGTRAVATLLGLPDFSASAATYFRLVGLLIAGLGLLYTVSGRLNAQGFVFASLLDRPIVPFVMLGLRYWGSCPAILVLAFGLQDFVSFLWTLWAWRRERKRE
jgi:Na+-driven multidrug efflux pump